MNDIQDFLRLNPDYPLSIREIEIESCTVSDDDIPSGNGGINGERYTYGYLRHHPIIPELLRRITTPQIRHYAEEANRRNADRDFRMYKVNGEYCFWGLRVGPIVKSPTLQQLRMLLPAEAVRSHRIDAAMIRTITYNLLRDELARTCGITTQEAALAIGNQLDCAPHEDRSGYIFMVPNWAHKWFRHDGYVSEMLSKL